MPILPFRAASHLDKKTKEIDWEDDKFKPSFNRVFHPKTKPINPDTVRNTLQQINDLWWLVEAVGMVIEGDRDIEQMKRSRSGQGPTSEELGELVVLRKIIKEIDAKVAEKRREANNFQVTDSDYVSDLNRMRRTFKGAEEAIMSGNRRI